MSDRNFKSSQKSKRRDTRPTVHKAKLDWLMLEDRINPAPIPTVVGLAGPGSTQFLLGESVSFSFNFSNTSPSDVGYSPYIAVAVDTSGPDGATSGPLDGFGTPVATAAGGPLQLVGQINLAPSQTTYTNPFTGQTGIPVPTGFGNNDTIYIYRLPFGSFTPGQTTLVNITMPTSNLADVGTPLNFAVTPGFRDDEPADNGPAINGTTVLTNATPQLYTLRKIYIGPENETATGPNYVRQYRLEVDVATGVTVTNLRVSDILPNTVQLVGRDTTVVAGNPNFFASVGSGPNSFSLSNLTTTGGAATSTSGFPDRPNQPGGTLQYSFGTVTGAAGVDAVLEFNFFVPRDDAGGGATVSQGTDSTNALNSSSALANWVPIDSRDSTLTNTPPAASMSSPNHTLEQQSLAVQKSIALFDLTTGAALSSILRPGQTLVRNTLRFQVSDYFALQNIRLNDVISDGQRLYLGTLPGSLGGGSATPTLAVNQAFIANGTSPGVGSRQNTSGVFSATGVIDYQGRFTTGNANSDPSIGVHGYGPTGPTGGIFNNLGQAPDTNPITGGTTFLSFNISQELQQRLGPNAGRLVGAQIANDGSGPLNSAHPQTPPPPAVTGTIVFWTLISEEFSDAFPSGNPSVDQGDTLTNTVENPATVQRDGIIAQQIAANTINSATPTVIGTASDDSGASFSIPRGQQTKTLTHINGLAVTQGPAPLSLQSGDVVTYKLTYTLPISSFEQLQILDIPPLPVMPVGSQLFYSLDLTLPSDISYNPDLTNPYNVAIAPDDTFFQTINAVGTVDLATVIPLPGATYTTTAGGTFTFSSPPVVDGVTVAAGMRILVKDQVDPRQNGIYVANTPTNWTRATDFDQPSEVQSARVFIVTNGNLNLDLGYIQSNREFLNFNTSSFTTGGIQFAPFIQTNQTTNTITFNFGNLSDTVLRRQTTISLYLSLPVGNTPYGQDVFLTNQLRINESSTNSGDATVENSLRFELVQPAVTIRKGAVAGGNTGLSAGGIAFANANNPTGTLTLGGNPLSSTNAIHNLTHANSIGGLNITATNAPVDAGDTVRYALVAQNNGKGDAFDVILRDRVQPGYVIPPTISGLNLRLFRGDGTALTTNANVNGFVKLATETDIGGTFNAGIGGGQFTGVFPIIDDVLLVVGDRVLVKDQTNSAQNGIYVVTARNPVNGLLTLTRAPDANTAATLSGYRVAVMGGTTWADNHFQFGTVATLNTSPASAGSALGVRDYYTTYNPTTGEFQILLSDNYTAGNVAPVTGDGGDNRPGALSRGNRSVGGPITNGSNTVIALYDVVLASSVNPLQTITNTAVVTNYASNQGFLDLTDPNNVPNATEPSDQATVEVRRPDFTKVLTNTEIVSSTNSNTQVVIGELVTYTLTLTVPEGVTPAARITDTLDNGLAFVDVVSVTFSSTALTASNTIGTGPSPSNVTITNSGRNLEFNFGTLTNTNNDNTIPETITIVYRAVVLNIASNQAGTQLNNEAQFRWQSTDTPIGSPVNRTQNQAAPTQNVTVIEPQLTTAKQLSTDGVNFSGGVPSNLDRDDQLYYRIVIGNNALTLSPSVRVATTGNIGTGFSTTSGVGQITGVPLTIDGVTLALGDRVLVKDQTNPASNGIYVVTALGTTATLTAAAEMDQTAEFLPGTTWAVQSGTVNSGRIYRQTSNVTVLYTSPVNFQQIIPTYTNPTDAFDVTVFDPIGPAINERFVPSGFTVTTSGGATAAASQFELVQEAGPGTRWILRTVDGQSFDMPVNSQVVITISGVVASGVSVSDNLQNTVDVRWTSLNDNIPSPAGGLEPQSTPSTIRSTHHPNSTERTGTPTDDGSGNLNDYATQAATAPLTSSPYLVKQVVSSSEGHTIQNQRLWLFGSASGYSGGFTSTTGSWTGNVTLQSRFVTVDATEAGGAAINLPTPVDLTGYTTLTFGVRALTGNAANNLVLRLTDSDGTTTTYTFPINSAMLPPGYTSFIPFFANLLASQTVTGGDSIFNFAEVTRIEIQGDGGSAPFRMEFREIVAQRTLAVPGEIIRYRLLMQLPEGTITDLHLRDSLPSGMQFLNDGTAKLAFVSNSVGVTSSTLSGPGLTITGNQDNLLDFDLSVTSSSGIFLPDAAISSSSTANVDVYNSSTPVFFKLGNIVNADNDSDSEFIVVEFNALVMNVATNQAGTDLSNRFEAFRDGSTAPVAIGTGNLQGNASPSAVNDYNRVIVVEPQINNLSKRIIGIPPLDTNDAFTYRISFSNNVAKPIGYEPQVRVASTANLGTGFSSNQITGVAAPGGVVIIDGVTLNLGDRVLVKNQTNASQNGIYELIAINPVSGTATLRRASDFDSATDEIAFDYRVRVAAGGQAGQVFQMSTTGPITVNTTAINWTQVASNPVVRVATTGTVNLSSAPASIDGVTLAVGDRVLVKDQSSSPQNGVYVFNGVGSAMTRATDFDQAQEFSRGLQIQVLQGTVNRGRVFAQYQTVTTLGSSSIFFRTVDEVTAFDVVMTDPLPPEALFQSVTIRTPYGNVTTTTGGTFNLPYTFGSPSGPVTGTAVLTVTVPPVNSSGTVTVTLSELRPENELATYTSGVPRTNVEIDVDAVITSTVAPFIELVNPSRLHFTSLPGISGTTINPTGSTTPGTAGTSTGERTGQDVPLPTNNTRPIYSTQLNNYAVGATHITRLNPTVSVKTIVATSEAHTTGSDVVVGEVVRYRLAVSIPEGTSTGVVLTDTLAPGLTFVPGSTVKIAFVGNGGLSSSVPSIGNAGGNLTLAPLVLDPITAFTLPASQISVSGQTVTFNLGDITNNDSDPDVEFILIEFNAIVANVVGNQAGTVLDNSFDTTINGNTTTSTAVPVTVREPAVSVDKEVIASTGGVVTYRITLANANTAGTATAFNTRVLDVLDGVNLSLVTGSVSSPTFTGGASGFTNASIGNTLDVEIAVMPAGSTVSFTYQANVLTTPTGTTTINNTAVMTFTSLPGDGTPSNPTGTNAGTPGTPTGERTGGGGVNDYTASDTERLGSLGDRVYFDANANGVQDSGEPGIVGVPITVVWAGPDGIFGTGDDSTITVLTGTNGEWTVTGLPVGPGQNYRVSAPTSVGGMALTDVRDNGGPPNTNPDGLGVGVSAITLTGVDAPTTNNRIQDFGYRGTASLGDRVYVDADGDGVQDANGLEPSLPGVTVTLVWAGLDGDLSTTADNLTFTTVTTATPGTSPNYLFQNLPAGNFSVSVSPVGGVGGVPDNMTLTDSVDNGGSPNPLATVTTTLTIGQNRAELDFGYRGTASIGDTVWYDANGNGVQDPGEPGIAGVTVTLVWAGPDGVLGNGDDVTFTTTTDADGNYLFPGLPVTGTGSPYRVTTSGIPAAFPVQTFDNDGLATPNQSTLTLGPTENNTAQDFGYRGTASLGNFVWEDLNGNGRIDSGEPGLDGVLVSLYYDANGDGIFSPSELATPLLTTTTSGGGLYGFNNLAAGKYRVQFGTLPGYVRTTQNSPVATAATDSNAAVADGFTATITLANGENNDTIDAGLYRPISLGDRVYFDANGNGVQDSGEPGIAGVPITVIWLGEDGVLGGGDDVTFTTTTGTNGIWTVNNLPPGNFQVTANPAPASGFNTLTDSIDNSGTPSPINPVTVSTNSGVNRTDIDFGYRGTASLGDRVWLDLDQDGIEDTNEPGIPGLVVTLTWFGSDGVLGGGDDFVITTTTGTNGLYLFDNLPAGNFSVSVNVSGWNLIPTYDLNNGTVSPTTSVTTTLTTGQNRTNVDFGLIGNASVGDRVWIDQDADGVQDSVEPGIPGATVQLTFAGVDGIFGNADDLVLTTTTGTNGLYLFQGLPVFGTPSSNNYRATVTSLPIAGLSPTADLDSPAPTGDGTASFIVTASGPNQNRTDVDFGYDGASSISGTVFHDLNNNGVFDVGEPGIPGVVITLTGVDPFGNPVLDPLTNLPFQAISDAAGNYVFSTVLPGTYTITQTQPTNFNDGLDSAGSFGGSTGNDIISGINVPPNSTGVNYNFGEVGTSLSGRVWRDDDRNGTQNGTEPGLAGVTISLFEADGTTAVINPLTGLPYVVLTDANGNYQFDNLPAGNYVIVQTQPTGYANTPTGPFTNNTRPVTLPLSGLTNQNFGEVLGSIAGTVYVDANNNGTRQIGEAAIPNVTITLTGTDILGNPVNRSVVTDSAGNYLFDHLLPPDANGYTITQTQPAPYTSAIANAPGTAGGTAVGSNQFTSIMLTDGQQAVAYNFGELQPIGAFISGSVYVDENQNGTRQPTESGIAGVTITLRDVGPDGIFGTGDDGPTFTTTTDALGNYLFTGLTPGRNYQIIETQPAIYANSPAGPSTLIVVNNLPATGSTGNNFGEILGSLSGSVYFDANNNGIRDAGEPGIAGVTITLTGTDVEGNPVSRTTTTDAAGNYTFTDLPAGTYVVTQPTQPAGYVDGVESLGSAGGVVGSDVISQIPLSAGANLVNYNFGELGVPVSGTVFRDDNRDGSRQSGEPGIANVVILLIDSDGNLVATTTTDANGNYVFPNVPPGNYTIVEVQPTGHGDPLSGPFAPNSRPITVAGTPITNQNFGDTLSTLSGSVYVDANDNGIREVGEVGISGVQMRLDFAGADGIFGTSDDVIGFQTTVTNANGDYTFVNLPNGVYRIVQPIQPSGFDDGQETPGTAGGTTLVNDQISNILLPAGVDRPGYLFGELPPPADLGQTFLAGTVYLDVNGNGVQDSGELGLAGVTITLTGPGGPFTTTTDAFGNYLFTNLDIGAAYTITQTQPSAYGTGPENAGNVISIPNLPAAGSTGNNFGETPGTISGRVYFDANDNGTFDGGDVPLNGVLLELLDVNGNPVPNPLTGLPYVVNTDLSGNYAFINLPAGTYQVRQTQPPGYNPGQEVPGNLISNIVLAPGGSSTNNNFGELGAPISGTVFLDANADGIRQPSETTGIAGVTITLRDSNGNVVATTTTDAAGNYLFANVPPGNYTIEQTQPSAYASSPTGPFAPNVRAVTQTSAGLTNQNFGEVLGRITGTVYADINNNGVQNPGEPGIPGVTITLTGTDLDGNFITRTTTTDALGRYEFTNLPAGTYTVTETQPNAYDDGLETLGSAGGLVGSDVFSNVPLGAGVNAVGYDFGELVSSVRGNVWIDRNRDGVRQLSESGLAGVTITLTGTDLDGNFITRTTTTDAAGNYFFPGVPAGTYTVTQTQPVGYGSSTPNVVTNLTVPLATLVNGPNFGETLSTIGGSVYRDDNNNGIRNSTELGIPGVTVRLTGTNALGQAVNRTTTTDANGFYVFRDLLSGTYTITQTQPAGFGDGRDRVGSVGGVLGNDVISQIPLPPGVDAVNYDFGELNNSSISGYVYRDLQVNGIREPQFGETGIGGVTITLVGTDLSGQSVLRTTTTDNNGFYRFDLLPPGNYTVIQTQPYGFYYDGLDSVGNLGGTVQNDRLSLFLPVGSNAVEYNFGENPPADPFGYVYVDLNRNGVRDAGEPGIAGVAVRISGVAFAGTPLERPLTEADVPGGLTRVTNSQGFWEFAIIPPGVYSVVQVVQPPGFIDGLEENADPNGPFTVIVGNDRFDNIVLSPFPIRGPFNFGEWLPMNPDQINKSMFLASSFDSFGRPLDVPTAVGARAGAARLQSPTFATTTGNPLAPVFVVTGAGPGDTPRVRVFDFSTGGEVWRFNAFEESFTGGVQAVSADLNGDGIPEIIAAPGAGGGPRLRVFDGRTNQLLQDFFVFEESFRGGINVAVGDFNGDGTPDVIIGTGVGGGPRIRVLDGRNFNELANFFAYEDSFRGGVVVAAGDLNNDGRADIIAGSGPGGGPRVRAFDAATLSVLADFFAYEASLRTGFWVGAADINGDGIAQIITGPGQGGGPLVRIFNSNGQQVDSLMAFADTFRGGVRVAAKDIDSDGNAELIIGQGPGGSAIRIFRLSDRALLEDFDAIPDNFVGGVFVG